MPQGVGKRPVNPSYKLDRRPGTMRQFTRSAESLPSLGRSARFTGRLSSPLSAARGWPMSSSAPVAAYPSVLSAPGTIDSTPGSRPGSRSPPAPPRPPHPRPPIRPHSCRSTSVPFPLELVVDDRCYIRVPAGFDPVALSFLMWAGRRTGPLPCDRRAPVLLPRASGWPSLPSSKDPTDSPGYCRPGYGARPAPPASGGISSK